ncbi:prephenate dehydratase [Williamsia limnetica]|uniref:prephenate dehydratase n=1 Tax=Williamsia limnetica TaxID=882452 RepID=A0A318RKE3_WILLI|nr:prephenate dehydratase [Williamsia limnetica]PYE18529.1 prephenate dehydratase [Williamsia limnetica]
MVPAIAYFGPSGTFTEMALDQLLTQNSWLTDQGAVERISASSPAATLTLVREGRADYGCVPIESSIEGSVPATLDALIKGSRVQIFAETVLDIAFTLAAREQIEASDIATIAAYPVASAQVRETLEGRYPDAQVITSASNAAAAQDVAAGRADAALTTALAARLYDLQELATGLADASDANTRFVLVGSPGPVPPRTGQDRTSVTLDLPNIPGSLMSAMYEFATRNIDLTRIESRPRRAGGFFFNLDVVGHLDDPPIAEALGALHRRATAMHFLGSWPSARPNGTPPPRHDESDKWLESIRLGKDR